MAILIKIRIAGLAFIPSVSNKFKHVIKDLDAKLFYFSMNKLDYIIKVHRNIVPI